MNVTDDSKVTPLHKASAALPRLLNFASIKREHDIIWPAATDEIAIQTGLFRTLLRLALEHVRVDERYYLRTYPDVGEAVATGLFTSPRHHYVEFGYFEDRLPFRIEVNEEFYFRSYPDVKANVSLGYIPSAQVHFEQNGYKEGRLPREAWSLLTG
jgi:hypothetical protein